MLEGLLESIQQDKRIHVSLPHAEIEKWLSKQILDSSDLRKVIFIVGPPGIGKSHLRNKVEQELADIVRSIDVKLIRDEEELGRRIELITSSNLMLDNFDSIFAYSFPVPKYDW